MGVAEGAWRLYIVRSISTAVLKDMSFFLQLDNWTTGQLDLYNWPTRRPSIRSTSPLLPNLL
jgi:hypothetical protein